MSQRTESPAAINDPHVSVEDREAVANVQKAILNWRQYKITIRRSEADLVAFVRKGRIASATHQISVFVLHAKLMGLNANSP